MEISNKIPWIFVGFYWFISVFPMEACDLIGGDACNVRMFSETKLPADLSRTEARAASEEVDRDYLEYNEPKTYVLNSLTASLSEIWTAKLNILTRLTSVYFCEFYSRLGACLGLK
jgi:Light regulated protein Lir1